MVGIEGAAAIQVSLLPCSWARPLLVSIVKYGGVDVGSGGLTAPASSPSRASNSLACCCVAGCVTVRGPFPRPPLGRPFRVWPFPAPVRTATFGGGGPGGRGKDGQALGAGIPREAGRAGVRVRQC